MIEVAYTLNDGKERVGALIKENPKTMTIHPLRWVKCDAIQVHKVKNKAHILSPKVKDCPHTGCMYFDNMCAGGNFQCTQEQIEINPDRRCHICDEEVSPMAEYCGRCLEDQI